MTTLHPYIADRPFWKVGGEYVSLRQVSLDPNITIDFDGTPDEIVREIVLHRARTMREEEKGDIEVIPGGIYTYQQQIEALEQNTELGRLLIRMDVGHLKDLYDGFRQGRYRV